MTLNLPDRIGMNVSAAAKAARLQAAADAAIRHSGLSPSVGTPGRGDYQATVRADDASSSVRAPGEAGTTRENRVRTAGYSVRQGPDPFFVTQMLAQSDRTAAHGAINHAGAVASYPSLVSDIDIFLLGEDVVFVETALRVDIHA